ncbi:MAG: hypothetical protein ACYTXJ_35850, partial [Nostoc sp.]
QKFFILLISIFVIGSFGGRKLEKSIDRQIDKFKDYPNFSITRGDKKAIEECEKGNQKLTRQILNKFMSVLISVLFSSFIKFGIDYLSSRNNLP